MESLNLFKFLTSPKDKNGAVRVAEIESVELSETTSNSINYIPCILFTMKSGKEVCWNYQNKEEMYAEFQKIKSFLKRVIICQEN